VYKIKVKTIRRVSILANHKTVSNLGE